MKYEWNFEEFVAFLLIYASYSDLDFSKAEKDHILEKIDEESFNKVEEAYLESSDFERLQIIMDHKGLYYPTVAQRSELFERIIALFNADGDYSKLESNLLKFLERLL